MVKNKERTQQMDEELGYTRYDYKEKEDTNSRNGHHRKTLKTEMGNFEIDVPQDTEGEFEPQIVPKHSRTVSPTIQDAILSMYAKGMSIPDINSHWIYNGPQSFFLLCKIIGLCVLFCIFKYLNYQRIYYPL